jgi:hypothetical protein
MEFAKQDHLGFGGVLKQLIEIGGLPVAVENTVMRVFPRPAPMKDMLKARKRNIFFMRDSFQYSQ